jgi:hypothetical protein
MKRQPYRLIESGRHWAVFAHGDEYVGRAVYRSRHRDYVTIERDHFPSLEAALDFYL